MYNVFQRLLFPNVAKLLFNFSCYTTLRYNSSRVVGKYRLFVHGETIIINDLIEPQKFMVLLFFMIYLVFDVSIDNENYRVELLSLALHI